MTPVMLRSLATNSRLHVAIRLSKSWRSFHFESAKTRRKVSGAALSLLSSETTYDHRWRAATVGAAAVLAGAFCVSKNESAYAESPAQQDCNNRDLSKAVSLGLGRYTIPDIVEKVNDTVVFIRVFREKRPFPPSKFFSDNPTGSEALEALGGSGSGFFFDERGLILTNAHVIEDALLKNASVEVILHNGRTLQGVVIAADGPSDIAIVKVKDKDKTFPKVKFGSSEKIRVGEWVVAVQCPLGEDFRNTVTLGILSGKKRELHHLPKLPEEFSGYARVGTMFMQSDCASNLGSSGSPLLNLDGEVIGMNTIGLGGPHALGTMSFAIPSDLIQKVVKELIEYGSTRRPLVGLLLVGLTEKAITGMYLRHRTSKYMEKLDQLARHDAHKQIGCLVHDVVKGSPAANAGLVEGDVVLEVDDVKIRKVSEFLAETRFKADQDVKLKVLRTTGNTETVMIRLGIRQLLPPVYPTEAVQKLIEL